MQNPTQVFSRIEHAFQASFERLQAAATFSDAEDEVSNLLHHLYRLFELAKCHAMVDKSALSHEARVLLSLRGADTHALVRISQGAMRFPITFPLCFTVPIFELVDGTGIDDPVDMKDFQDFVHGKAAAELLPHTFDEIRSKAGFAHV